MWWSIMLGPMAMMAVCHPPQITLRLAIPSTIVVFCCCWSRKILWILCATLSYSSPKTGIACSYTLIEWYFLQQIDSSWFCSVGQFLCNRWTWKSWRGSWSWWVEKFHGWGVRSSNVK
jgi:hypothetical protein